MVSKLHVKVNFEIFLNINCIYICTLQTYLIKYTYILFIAIKCEPLKQVPNGQISPENCSGPEKLPFGTNCTISCRKGFTLEGPRSRHCSGRSGVWSQRKTVNRCVGNVMYYNYLYYNLGISVPMTFRVIELIYCFL